MTLCILQQISFLIRIKMQFFDLKTNFNLVTICWLVKKLKILSIFIYLAKYQTISISDNKTKTLCKNFLTFTTFRSFQRVQVILILNICMGNGKKLYLFWPSINIPQISIFSWFSQYSYFVTKVNDWYWAEG